MTFDRTRVSVAVIGAGQAGLSVAYYLQKLGLKSGVDLGIFDRGPGPGGAWQLRTSVTAMGRTQTCSPNNSIAGYLACS